MSNTNKQTIENNWRDDNNWSIWGYRCSADPRVVVPKRCRGMGWTINWAHPKAVLAIMLIFVVAVGPFILSVLVGQTVFGATIVLLCSIAAVIIICSRLSSL